VLESGQIAELRTAIDALQPQHWTTPAWSITTNACSTATRCGCPIWTCQV
jgi:hypothetical protein